jgi:hypothetical protein
MEKTEELCAELKKCFVTMVAGSSEIQGTVEPVVPELSKGIEAVIEVAEGEPTKIVVRTERTNPNGHMMVDHKRIFSLFSSLAYMRTFVRQQPTVELLGFYKEEMFHVTIDLVEKG